jgi:hypothetical protein
MALTIRRRSVRSASRRNVDRMLIVEMLRDVPVLVIFPNLGSVVVPRCWQRSWRLGVLREGCCVMSGVRDVVNLEFCFLEE